MFLAAMDLWNIVDGSKDATPSIAEPKVLKYYQWCIKIAMFIIGCNLVDNQLGHIKSYKKTTRTWKNLCGIY